MEFEDDSAYAPTNNGGHSLSVYLCKEQMKFNAAHFIAYEGYRERLHGHNYKVALKVWGQRSSDGYVIDFGVVKSAVRSLCKELNEHVLIPCRSDVLVITKTQQAVQVKCQDGSCFSFPIVDCKMLPIVHSSGEELAQYMLWRTIKHFGEEYLKQDRKIRAMELSVAEAENQYATYYVDLNADEDASSPVRMPCPCHNTG